jgi:hypothetical protein
MVLRIIIERQDHEVLRVDRVMHDLKENYRQIRPSGIRGGQSDSWS